MRKQSFQTPGQEGFSLVEVLVSIVIFSFGLLGVAGLQLAGLQGSRDAQSQAAAVRFAREYAELMRGNSVVAASTVTANNPYLIDVSTGPGVSLLPAPCYTNTCSTAPIASQPLLIGQSDVLEWVSRVFDPEGGLPTPHVVVCFDSAPYDAANKPRWACDGFGGVSYIKIGWSQRSLNRAADGSSGNNVVELATGAGSRPSLLFPVSAGPLS